LAGTAGNSQPFPLVKDLIARAGERLLLLRSCNLPAQPTARHRRGGRLAAADQPNAWRSRTGLLRLAHRFLTRPRIRFDRSSVGTSWESCGRAVHDNLRALTFDRGTICGT